MTYRVWDQADPNFKTIATIDAPTPEIAAQRYVEDRWIDQYQNKKTCECWVWYLKNEEVLYEEVLYVVRVEMEPVFSATRKQS